MLMDLQIDTPKIEGMEDYACMPVKLFVLSLPDFSDGVKDLQKLILFDENYLCAKRVSLSEYKEYAQKRNAETHTRDNIYNAALSPDGKYALVLIGQKHSFSARIVNTETLEISPVRFDEDLINMSVIYGAGVSADYPVGMQFIANDLMIIATENGIRLFRIQ